ncbi:MAG: formate dehydrogenase, partial [Gammaproteobacteria bacterium]
IMAGLLVRLRDMYRKDGGAFPDPIVNLTWKYAQPESPDPEELAREYSGSALKELPDPKDPTKIIRKAGEQLAGFAELRDDGSTQSGCWIFCGAWGPTGNLMARRDNADPTGIGNTVNWAWAWPANRRVLYNRASCDTHGKPFNPKRKLIAWNGSTWGGADVPDFKLDENPDNGMGPFIMNPEGVARFFARGNMAEGPFPEHYEPFETPLAANPLSPNQPQALNNPAARVFKQDREAFGKADKFPHVATTYRLTEHFHYWTKHVRLNAITQPEQFVEIGAALADELGIGNGSRVRVSSNRGHIEAVAMVTKRIKPLMIEGKQVHTVGMPIHWGFLGVAKPGYLTNTLTPFVGDANTQTPEFKSFLVKVEKV